EITAKLARQRIDLGALSLSLAAGTVSAHPIIALDRTPETLLLPAGAALRDVELTPEMCAAWIKYMAPAMANAAEIEGSFSVLLNESSLPLADPQAGNVAGT